MQTLCYTEYDTYSIFIVAVSATFSKITLGVGVKGSLKIMCSKSMKQIVSVTSTQSSFKDQSRCREGSTLRVSLHQNFKLNFRIDVCTDFKQLVKN